MRTSSNVNIFRLDGPLWGESTGPVISELPSLRSVTRSFDVFFGVRLNKRLSNKSRRWWFETPWHSLWSQCNGLAKGNMLLASTLPLHAGLKPMTHSNSAQRWTCITREAALEFPSVSVISYGCIGRIGINEYDAGILDAPIRQFSPSVTTYQWSLDMQHILYWFSLHHVIVDMVWSGLS